MKVRELLSIMNEMVESGELSEDSEVSIAYQPNYPMQASAVNVAVDEDGRVVVVATDDEWYGSKAYWDEDAGWV